MGIWRWLRAFVREAPLEQPTGADRLPSEIAAIRRMKKGVLPEEKHAAKAEKAVEIKLQPGLGEASQAGIENDDFHSGAEHGEWGAILRRGTDGRPLSFVYTKKYGVVSTRTLFEWVEYPQHVQGFCSEAGAVLCFRKDRVSEWLAMSNTMLRAPKGKSRR